LSVHFFLASRTILTAMNYLRASCSSFRSLCDLPRCSSSVSARCYSSFSFLASRTVLNGVNFTAIT
jgi:hypothetical protein